MSVFEGRDFDVLVLKRDLGQTHLSFGGFSKCCFVSHLLCSGVRQFLSEPGWVGARGSAPPPQARHLFPGLPAMLTLLALRFLQSGFPRLISLQ